MSDWGSFQDIFVKIVEVLQYDQYKVTFFFFRKTAMYL